MKRNLLSILLTVLTILSAHSQTQNCKINGTLIDQSFYKYAYLYISKTKELSVTPILANKFQFNIANQKEAILGIMFLGLDSLKTYDDVLQNGIVGNRISRLIALENLDINIIDNINTAIINGGNLNKDLDQMSSTSKSLDFKPFFEQHPDSPIALIFLKSLTAISKNHLLAQYVDCKTYYNDLSDRLKNSSEGKEVWAKIND